MRTKTWFVALMLSTPAIAWGIDKPAKVTVMLSGAAWAGCVAKFQAALGRVPGIKFQAADIQAGTEPRFRSAPFVIEIADPEKTDIGVIAKAVAATDTPHKGAHPPRLNLVLYGGPITEVGIMSLRTRFSAVKGNEATLPGGLGAIIKDEYFWLRLDESDKAQLESILKVFQDAGTPVTLAKPAGWEA